ncbi:hypothetical protein BDZ91DRAFT_824526, partial [Kalaharituber pfeilii]
SSTPRKSLHLHLQSSSSLHLNIPILTTKLYSTQLPTKIFPLLHRISQRQSSLEILLSLMSMIAQTLAAQNEQWVGLPSNPPIGYSYYSDPPSNHPTSFSMTSSDLGYVDNSSQQVHPAWGAQAEASQPQMVNSVAYPPQKPPQWYDEMHHLYMEQSKEAAVQGRDMVSFGAFMAQYEAVDPNLCQGETPRAATKSGVKVTEKVASKTPAKMSSGRLLWVSPWMALCTGVKRYFYGCSPPT